MRRNGVDPGYIRIVQDMRQESCSGTRHRGTPLIDSMSRVGIQQGSVLSPYFLIMLMDDLLIGVEGKTLSACCLPMTSSKLGILMQTWKSISNVSDRPSTTSGWRLAKQIWVYGLPVGRWRTSGWDPPWQPASQKRVSNTVHVGWMVQNNGDSNADVTHRIKSRWAKWTSLW